MIYGYVLIIAFRCLAGPNVSFNLLPGSDGKYDIAFYGLSQHGMLTLGIWGTEEILYGVIGSEGI